jgi:hypothetical protein
MIRNCIICEKELESSVGFTNDMDFQDPPSKATCFSSSGNFGSAVFDPMDGTRIEISVCDDCLLWKKQFVIGFSTKTTIEVKFIENPF